MLCTRSAGEGGGVQHGAAAGTVQPAGTARGLLWVLTMQLAGTALGLPWAPSLK